jgi:hypothetical protein
MDYLIEFSRRGDVEALVTRVIESANVQGVVVDLDPFWLLGWQARSTLTPLEFRAWDDALAQWIESELQQNEARPRPWPPPWQWGQAPFEGVYPVGVDTSFRFEAWRRLAHWRATSDEPFVVKVIRRPRAVEPDYLEEQLQDERLRILFETRPAVRAYSKPTDKVRPLVGGLSAGPPQDHAGTLGGILEDGNGTRYALTCSHVAAVNDDIDQPSHEDDAHAAEAIGQCVASTSLQPPTPHCNPYAGNPDRVDAALVALDAGMPSELEVLGVGDLTGRSRASDLHPGMTVDVAGKRSGLQALRVGGLSVSNPVSIDGQSHCFKDLFELTRLSRHWGATGTARQPVRPGDSGAWVIAQGPLGPEWCGMVLGGGGPVGYAMFSEFVDDWLAAEGFSGLAV